MIAHELPSLNSWVMSGEFFPMDDSITLDSSIIVQSFRHFMVPYPTNLGMFTLSNILSPKPFLDVALESKIQANYDLAAPV